MQQNRQTIVSTDMARKPRQTMERNRWETAVRCLEVALHPNTRDDEVVAAVNGFRRIANGTPLSEVCAEFVSKDYGVLGPVGYPVGSRKIVDWQYRENLDLKRRLEVAEAGQIVTVRRLHETEQRLQDLGEALVGAKRQAEAAKQQLADFRSAYSRISDRLNHEICDLREALEQARRTPAERPAQRVAPPFQEFLAAAGVAADQPQTVIARRREAPDQDAQGSGSPIFNPSPRRPWTA
jgi:hypothetical protein